MSELSIEEGLVAVQRGHVFVRKWSPADVVALAPVILLHDSLGSVELWRHFPEALARRLKRSVIAYDRLGFGRSSARAARPSIDFIEEEASTYFPAVRSALGVSDYALFGHSVGGAMAVAIAASDRSGCEWLVTESAQAFLEARTLDGIRAASEQFSRPGQLDRLARWHGDKAHWVLDAWAGVWLSPAFASWSLDRCLARVTSPVLAIHGEQDEYGSVAFPHRIASGVQGPSQLAILERCGHVPHREQQERVLDLVCGFVASVGQSDAGGSAGGDQAA